MKHHLVMIAIGAEETGRKISVVGKLIGFFPEGHAVRECADRCPKVQAIIAEQKPREDEDEAMRAVRSYSVDNSEPFELALVNAIASVVEPEGSRPIMPSVVQRRIAAAGRRRDGVRVRPAGTY